MEDERSYPIEMKLKEAFHEVRRKLGFILPIESDIVWKCNKVVSENREVFDRLARS